MTASRWRGWLVAAAIFLLGVAVGGAGTMALGVRAFRKAMQSPATTRGMADRAVARIGADLTESLQLTPEQSARVQAVLDASAKKMKAIRVEAAVRAIAELRESTDQIAAELPPDKHAELYRVVGRRFERLGLEPPRPPNAKE
jgi:hypothetical protein